MIKRYLSYYSIEEGRKWAWRGGWDRVGQVRAAKLARVWDQALTYTRHARHAHARTHAPPPHTHTRVRMHTHATRTHVAPLTHTLTRARRGPVTAGCDDGGMRAAPPAVWAGAGFVCAPGLPARCRGWGWGGSRARGGRGESIIDA